MSFNAYLQLLRNICIFGAMTTQMKIIKSDPAIDGSLAHRDTKVEEQIDAKRRGRIVYSRAWEDEHVLAVWILLANAASIMASWSLTYFPCLAR